MTDINIPPEALEAALPFAALCAYYCKPSANDCQCRQNTHAACTAMLRAWPGMEYMMGDEAFPFHYIILPLPQENTNDVA